MLSIIDLIERGTLGLETAAYLAARVHAGASFIVGAVPGGAGKTTVMGALLNLLPLDTEIFPAENEAVISELESHRERACALVHEISSGQYYCYLWGTLLRRFFALHEGHILAANLHADNLDQARSQICDDNGVPEEDFNAIDLFLFLGSSGGPGARRILVTDIQTFDEDAGHHMPLTPGKARQFPTGIWKALLKDLIDRKVLDIQSVRREILAHEAGY